jgi:transcriptional antiterminator RfaH
MERWYVLMSKPRSELRACQHMRRKGMRVYLPLLPPSGMGRAPTPRPLFPRYFFAQLDLSRVLSDAVRWTPGLSGFVSFGPELATVSDMVIEHIKARLEQIADEPAKAFCQGQRVRIAAWHPLARLEGLFDKPLSDGQRARIFVEVLGRLTRCEVDMDALESVDAPIWSRGESMEGGVRRFAVLL